MWPDSLAGYVLQTSWFWGWGRVCTHGALMRSVFWDLSSWVRLRRWDSFWFWVFRCGGVLIVGVVSGQRSIERLESWHGHFLFLL
ncbi:hypothetical protein B0J18DRAFT_70000 [Chaetomium sp. MPI-SDFR-AT-0129]|nr:hypothetical protein B0J18DRAFT_70000 [Chaetomium sp. MPI-SDFR-AT-0129]